MAWAILIFSLLFPWLLSYFEARKDAKRIMDWDHFMEKEFHFKYGLLRGLVLLLVAGFISWYHWGDWHLISACGAYQICAFGYGFTSLLNTRRGLARWYQSRQPNAAWLDRCFVAVSKKTGRKPEELAGEVYPALLALSTMLYLQHL